MNQAFENHRQWSAVKAACEKLSQNGFLTYLAGGCVRDFLMGRTPHDFDIASQATPEQVEVLFPNSLMVGRQFGVSIIPYAASSSSGVENANSAVAGAGTGEGFQLEIATFRKDGDYQDGRHPEGVIYSDEIEDAKRRDFTVNALFFDLKNNRVIDHVNGQEDLKNKLLRAVGDPARRFTEDKLRLMRAVRFAAQLEFEIESATWKEVERLAPEITVVSRERVRDEMIKLLSVSGRNRGLMLLKKSGLIEALFPALGSAFEEPEFEENFEATFELISRELSRATPALEASVVLTMLKERPTLWLGLFFMNHIGAQGQKALTGDEQFELLNSLKIDNQTRDGIVWMWRHFNSVQSPDTVAPLERAKLLMSPWWGFTFSLCCVLNSHLPSEARDDVWRETIEHFEKQGGVIGQKLVPWITGKDLQQNGFAQGIEMGRLLDEALKKQMLGEWNSRDEGLSWLREWSEKRKTAASKSDSKK